MTCVSRKAVTQVVCKGLEKGSNLNNIESHLRNSLPVLGRSTKLAKAAVHNSLQGHTRIRVLGVFDDSKVQVDIVWICRAKKRLSSKRDNRDNKP